MGGFKSLIRKSFFQSKRRVIRYGLLSANIVIVLSIVTFVITNRNVRTETSVPVLNLVAADDSISSPLDTISSADIAVNIALMTGMPQTTAVLNHADSASTYQEVVPSGSQAVSKPQILRTDLKSKSDIQEYVVAEGDTLESLAEKFGVSSKSIRWSNNLTGTSLGDVGSTLVIPPVEGIIHVVSEGDTVDSLATKYRGDKDRITAFNDAEINGLVAGEKIVVPDGEIVPVARPSFSAPAVAGGFTARYGPANGYDFGWCTWHAANRRREIGKPLPSNLGNAVTWSPRARGAGMAVSDVPVAGAVIWHDQGVSGTIAGGLGHVAYVEAVNPDGSIVVSDMNSRGFSNPDGTGAPTGGWSRVSYRVVSPDQFSRYDFIY